MSTGRKRTSSVRGRALVRGYRSGLEEKVASELTALKVDFEFEKLKVKYTKPTTQHTYTPDFVLLHNGIIVETKGRFLSEDRRKHLLIREQSPHMDIRFVFSNMNAKISKASKTTYAMWCSKHNFKYAEKSIPIEWIEERRKKNDRKSTPGDSR